MGELIREADGPRRQRRAQRKQHDDRHCRGEGKHRLAATIASECDVDLEAKVRQSGDVQPWFEFLDGIALWRQRSRAMRDLCDAAEARLFIVLGRVLEIAPEG